MGKLETSKLFVGIVFTLMVIMLSVVVWITCSHSVYTEPQELDQSKHLAHIASFPTSNVILK